MHSQQSERSFWANPFVYFSLFNIFCASQYIVHFTFYCTLRHVLPRFAWFGTLHIAVYFKWINEVCTFLYIFFFQNQANFQCDTYWHVSNIFLASWFVQIFRHILLILLYVNAFVQFTQVGSFQNVFRRISRSLVPLGAFGRFHALLFH